LYPLPVLVQDDLSILDGDDGAGLFLWSVLGGVGGREDILVRDG
jgi:hypothetical protein